MRKFSLFIILVSLTLLQACQNNADGGKQIILPKDKGGVQLKLAAAPTKSATDPNVPTADQFHITFTTTTDSVVFESLFSEVPYVIVLPAGAYNAVAQYGVNAPFSTDTPYYRSEKNFEIEMGQTTYLDMRAVLNSFIVDIVYQADFDKYFSNYYVVGEVYGGENYTFAENLAQSAYFAPCKLRLVLKGTLTDGRPYSSIISEFTSPGTELHRLKINILPKGHAFDISIDETVTVVDITSSIPDSWRPDMPAVPALSIATYETATIAPEVTTTVVVPSILKLADLCIALDDNLKAIFNAKDTLRVSVAEDLAALNAMGIYVAPDIIGKQNGTLNFARLAAALLSQGGVATQYKINVKSEDFLANKNAANDVTITVTPPIFEMPEVPAGNIWTKEFTFVPISQNDIVEGNYDKMVANGGFTYQYSDNGTHWADIADGQLTLASLAPNGTQYQLRAIYRGVISAVRTVATAATSAIPLGDLENWSAQSYRSECYKIGDGSIWSTRNSMTTGSGLDTYACRYSGTYPVNGHKGKGAEIATCGWGAGNTWAGMMWSAAIYNISAGSMFLGSYNNGELHGYPFATRPTSLTFYYKYSPYKNDEMRAWIQVENRTDGTTTVLASNEFKSTASSSNYAEQKIALNYTNTHLPATHICIAFYSGKNEGSKDYIQGYSSGFYGSRLYVDELSFGYDK